MFRAYLRHLYRDRRRIVLAVALLLGAVYLADSTLPDPLPWLSSEAAIVIAGLVLIPLVTLVFRRHRHWIEIVALADFAYAALAHEFPGSPFDYHGLVGPLAPNALAWAFTIVVARLLLYGHWADRFAPRRMLRSTTRFRSRADQRALWYGLIPSPGHVDRFAEPDVVSADYTDASHSCVRMITWAPGRGAGESLLHLDAMRPFHFVRARLVVVEGVRDAAMIGSTELTLRDRGHFRELVLRHEGNGLEPRRILRGWLDDTLGRMFDQRIRAIERGVDRTRPSRMAESFSSWYDEPEQVTQNRRAGNSGYRNAYDRPLTAREEAAIAAIGGHDQGRDDTAPLPDRAKDERPGATARATRAA